MSGTWLYRHPQGLADHFHRHEGPGEPPLVMELDGVPFDRQWEVYDPKHDSLGLGVVVGAPVRPSLRDGRFKSFQRPRWDRFHKANGGEFDAQGHPLFTSRAQADEVAAIERIETGVDVRYREL